MNTEYDVCDPALRVLEVVGLVSLWVLFSWRWAPAEGTRLTSSKSKACCSAKGGSIWTSRCHRRRAERLRFGSEKESAKSPAFLQCPGLEGVLAQHLVPEQMRKSDVIDELLSTPSRSLSHRWPPASLQDCRCSPPHGESSSYQMEGRQEESGAINFPLQTPLCTSARRQPLGTDDSFVFLRCYSKGCTIYQQFFLIT